MFIHAYKIYMCTHNNCCNGTDFSLMKSYTFGPVLRYSELSCYFSSHSGASVQASPALLLIQLPIRVPETEME